MAWDNHSPPGRDRPSRATAIRYDPEGNRTVRFVDADGDGVLDAGDTSITEYGWDNRNRLVEITDLAVFGGSPTQVVDYLFDVENRWIGSLVDGNGDGVVDQ